MLLFFELSMTDHLDLLPTVPSLFHYRRKDTAPNAYRGSPRITQDRKEQLGKRKDIEQLKDIPSTTHPLSYISWHPFHQCWQIP
jgi:hypothetical protein